MSYQPAANSRTADHQSLHDYGGWAKTGLYTRAVNHARRAAASGPAEGRPDLWVQLLVLQPQLPPAQAVPALVGHGGQAGLAPVDDPKRPHLHPRSLALPRLT